MRLIFSGFPCGGGKKEISGGFKENIETKDNVQHIAFYKYSTRRNVRLLQLYRAHVYN